MDGIFLSALQMLLLHTKTFSLFKSLEAFKELNCVEVWMILLTSGLSSLTLLRRKDVLQKKSYADNLDFCSKR